MNSGLKASQGKYFIMGLYLLPILEFLINTWSFTVDFSEFSNLTLGLFTISERSLLPINSLPPVSQAATGLISYLCKFNVS